MSDKRVHNVNIISEKLLPTPREVCERFPRGSEAENTVLGGRHAIQEILKRNDKRVFVIVGPCSIHDLDVGREYAHKLNTLAEKVKDTMAIVMRVYFEKPRTVIGWKGFINDPFLDDSFRIDEGFSLAREFLLELATMGLPAGTEALDPITPQYIIDLISWVAIGARTTESQTHRELASGLSAPVGFKNGTDGNREVAINALKSARHAQHFLGVSLDGQSAVFHTNGNPHGHIILRGGSKRPNYDSVNVALCEQELEEAGLPVNIVVDCSHGNSLKNHDLQPLVLEDCINQINEGNKSIVGFMLESNLAAGKQPITKDKTKLQYGTSITDACIGWETTEEILLKADERLRDVLNQR